MRILHEICAIPGKGIIHYYHSAHDNCLVGLISPNSQGSGFKYSVLVTYRRGSGRLMKVASTFDEAKFEVESELKVWCESKNEVAEVETLQ